MFAEFTELNEEILSKALQLLESQEKAEIILLQDTCGVKIFWLDFKYVYFTMCENCAKHFVSIIQRVLQSNIISYLIRVT